jgi:hypothetical protein
MPDFSAELHVNYRYVNLIPSYPMFCSTLTSKSIFSDKIFQQFYSPIVFLLNNAYPKQILVGPDQKNIVVDRHRIEADPDPAPTFHFYANPDLDLDPTPSLTHVQKSELLLLFIAMPVFIFFLSRQFHTCHNLQYFGQYFKNILV